MLPKFSKPLDCLVELAGCVPSRSFGSYSQLTISLLCPMLLILKKNFMKIRRWNYSAYKEFLMTWSQNHHPSIFPSYDTSFCPWGDRWLWWRPVREYPVSMVFFVMLTHIRFQLQIMVIIDGQVTKRLKRLHSTRNIDRKAISQWTPYLTVKSKYRFTVNQKSLLSICMGLKYNTGSRKFHHLKQCNFATSYQKLVFSFVRPIYKQFIKMDKFSSSAENRLNII